VKRQNCISNTEAIRQVLFLKDLRQEGSPQTPQKGYETEFHVQERSQTGVWERAGNLSFRTVCLLGNVAPYSLFAAEQISLIKQVNQL
jgi:hypothetical protein